MRAKPQIYFSLMKFHSLRIDLRNSLLAISTLMAVAMQPASGAVLKVRNLNDDGKGSLRQVIRSAANKDQIQFQVSGHIQLLTGELLVDKDLTIEGPSSGDLVIDAGGNSRIFNLCPRGAEVTLRRLKLLNGKDVEGGGAVISAGDLTIEDCEISNCASGEYTEFGISGGSGGAVLNVGGKLKINRSTIRGNLSYAGGGVAIVDGTLRICDSRVDGNVGGVAGGIEVQNSVLTLLSTSVSSNRSLVDAAGIEFYLSCTASVERCQFVRNQAALGAGAILTDYGCNIALRDSRFLENIGDYGDGGAIKNWEVMSIIGCTFAGNRVYYYEDLSQGGAIYNGGFLTVENSTFSGNCSGFGGGAILNSYQLTLRHCTLTGNESRYGGALSTLDYPEIVSAVENTIIAGNIGTALDLPAPDFSGAISSFDYNLIGQLSNGTLNGPTEHTLFGTLEIPLNALLGPLQFNGGPTPTHSPLVGSPAIDAGFCTGLNVDQRGYRRPVGASCDIGAVEVQ